MTAPVKAPPDKAPPDYRAELGRLQGDVRAMRNLLRAEEGEGNVACALRAACLAYPAPRPDPSRTDDERRLDAMNADEIGKPRLVADVARQAEATPKPVDTEDADPANMNIRAGYLQGLAIRVDGRLTNEDREFLRRASRSLVHAARLEELRALVGKS